MKHFRKPCKEDTFPVFGRKDFLMSLGVIGTFCDTMDVFWQNYPSAKVWSGQAYHSRV